MEPYLVGMIVEYKGSLEHMHGRYEIVDRMSAVLFRPDLLSRKGQEYMDEKYPDGVAYTLWPVGVEKNYRNREKSLNSVRRDSIAPVE